MSVYNYVATLHKPTVVTHGCVGYFTAPDQRNLILAKHNHVEIHLVTPRGVETISDFPIYGCIATMILFRFNGENQDSLFISTHEYRYCVLGWDSLSEEIVTRTKGYIPFPEGNPWPSETDRIAIIDPCCRLVGLHIYDRLLTIIPFDENNNGQLKEPFHVRLGVSDVMDIVFAFGFEQPTICVLYEEESSYSIKTYEVHLNDGDIVECPWSLQNLPDDTCCLIPVPPPYNGLLIIGGNEITYSKGSTNTSTPVETLLDTYGRGVDAKEYLLGGDGLLYFLTLAHENDNVTGLEIERAAKTSVASTLSYIGNGLVYVGSKCGYSQLIKFNRGPDKEGYFDVEVLKRYINLGPIADICMADESETQGQGQLVACTGAGQDGSLHIIRNGVKEGASFQVGGIITGMWSLKLTTDVPYDTSLVVSYISETRILEWKEGEPKPTVFDGLYSEGETLFCHNAVYDQFVQVTSKSVRLVSITSKSKLDEWKVPAGCSISVATGNAKQVLLAASGSELYYLEVGCGLLKEQNHTNLNSQISCLTINPVGEDPNDSKIAGAGTWDRIVVLFSLPGLEVLTDEPVGGIPHSALICAFEGIPYLMCGFGDGYFFQFVLNTSTGKLRDRKKVSCGTKPVALQRFSVKNTTQVLAASDDRSKVIYISNGTLLYRNVNLKDATHVCPFNGSADPDSFFIVKEERLIVGTIEDTCEIRLVAALDENAICICNQTQSRTYAICCVTHTIEGAFDHFGEYSIRLLDNQDFETLHRYPLFKMERSRAIVNCSFSDDDHAYYCVGTGIEHTQMEMKGRILVFLVEGKLLKLVAETKVQHEVLCLKSFNGKLLALIGNEIVVYTWSAGSWPQLHEECKVDGVYALGLDTRGEVIMHYGGANSVGVLIHERGVLKKISSIMPTHHRRLTIAANILNEGIYLGFEECFDAYSLFTLQSITDGALEVAGKFYLGELVRCFWYYPTDSDSDDVRQVSKIIYGTTSGAIGVVASISQELYLFFEQLQASMRDVTKSAGGFLDVWRSFYNDDDELIKSTSFLDGDLIRLFPDLGADNMEEIASVMGVSVEWLIKKVEELGNLTSF